MRNPYKIFWRKLLGRCQLGRLRRRRRKEQEEEWCGVRLVYSHSVQLALGMTPDSLIGVKAPKREANHSSS
jgi:hypothetical protein